MVDVKLAKFLAVILVQVQENASVVALATIQTPLALVLVKNAQSVNLHQPAQLQVLNAMVIFNRLTELIFLPDCADDKCLKCNARNPGSCQVCADGYVAHPVTKKCDKCYDPQCPACVRSGQEMSQQCTKCSRGYFPNGIACEPCADKDCIDCFGIDQGKCSACQNGYFKTQENTCKACEDEGCTSCSVSGTGKCSACASDYYLKDNMCVPCDQGKSSPPGSKSIEACIRKQTLVL